ncbi:J domain-containing protein [Homoserinibacter sp. GY 40078]|uniref:J domain-containing protein n=1 Tax=Homoserinibacter sp. GY 40078 TaxID=2603275 RepID=UPI0011C83C0B|nr:J domain-containing protein [Homoserinibacter sp. GY 40078]TXK17337.1 DnaJ domain-containing protein [Homoserinibacter sp. GY 40078]
MPDGPLASSPYEILRVSADASEAELRRAYRMRVRETHPDHGGVAAEFHAVQLAWELVGSAEARAAYDAHGRSDVRQEGFAPPPPRQRRDSRPQARSSGHPGGWHRERYLAEIREFAGRGVEVPDPYDAALVRGAPRAVRHLLASAIAEEESARELATLGIGYTVWHDVATPAGKLDHIVLGASGLWALLSADWGGDVRSKGTELVGPAVAGERPMHDLSIRARAFGRAARVKFSALGVVVPDADAPGFADLGSLRGSRCVLIPRPQLAHVIRTGVPGVGTGGTDLFELRTRVQSAVRFV